MQSTSVNRVRYQGLDRRAAAPMVESLNLPRAMAVLSTVFVTTLVLPARSSSINKILGHTLAPAGCLAVFACVALFMQWRIAGRAQAWWLAVGYVVAGIPALLQSGPVNDMSIHLASFVVAFVFFFAAWRAPEVDSALSTPRGFAACAGGLGGVFLLHRLLTVPAAALLTGAVAAVAFGTLAMLWHRSQLARASFVIPLIGFAMCCGVTVFAGSVTSRGAALGSVELFVNVVAALSALAGLQAAATSEGAHALDVRRERDLLEARQRDIEARFAETMSAVQSTASALEGGIRVQPPTTPHASEDSDDPLLRALIAEVQRLGAMAATVSRVHSEFPVAEALEAPLALWRANGWPVSSQIDQTVVVRGRPAEVTQIVHGLLSNARKYAPGAPVEVATMLTPKFILVLVDDGGPGVRPAHRERIFERGERPAHRDATDGQGLGLHIGRQIARSLGGELWVEQNPRGGARFVLALQRAQSADERPANDIREAAL